MFFPEISGD